MSMQAFRSLPYGHVAGASATATVLGSLIFGTLFEICRGRPVVESPGWGLMYILGAVVFFPHVLLGIWVLTSAIALGLLKLGLARAAICAAIGLLMSWAFQTLLYSGLYVGEVSKSQAMVCSMLAGIASGLMLWGFLAFRLKVRS